MRLPRLFRTVLFGLAAFMGTGLVCWIAAEGSARLFFGMHPQNRLRIYALRNAVRPGMRAEELQELLAAEATRGIQHSRFGETGVSVWTHTGLMGSCYLLVQLHEGKVVHASIRGERGDHHRLPGAPADF
jgi:hypothetical protein